MATHRLKIKNEYLEALLTGDKTFEIRYNDRGYQKHDVLEFHHKWGANNDWIDWALVQKYFGGKDIVQFIINYVHSGLGMENNYVVLGVERLVILE